MHPKSSDIHAHLAHHATAGTLTLNLLEELPTLDASTPPTDNTPTPPTDEAVVLPHTSSSRSWIVFAHGILLSLGFLVLLPAGSLVARWSRSFSPAWFKTHRLFNLYIALPLIVVGWLLAPFSVWKAGSKHFSDRHQVRICSIQKKFCASNCPF